MHISTCMIVRAWLNKLRYRARAYSHIIVRTRCSIRTSYMASQRHSPRPSASLAALQCAGYPTRPPATSFPSGPDAIASNERSFVCISEPWRTGAWLAVCVRRCASACECVRVRVWRASVRACVCASVTGVWVCQHTCTSPMISSITPGIAKQPGTLKTGSFVAGLQ